MSKTVPAIRGVKARGLVAPISRPVKNAFGVIDAAPMVLIDVDTDQGVTGRAYIFAYARMTVKPLVHLIEDRIAIKDINSEKAAGTLSAAAKLAVWRPTSRCDTTASLRGWTISIGSSIVIT